MNNQKRSLEDYGFLANLKRRRHLSPQNSNIDLNESNDSVSSLRKKTRTKSKNSLNESNGHTTPRKTSSRHQTSFQQMTEINLPDWERICPHIDQILSNKHVQSGVFAHEVQLVQQELEALLSMAFVREAILKEMSKSSNNDNIRSKIRKYQEVERVYSTKKLPKKKPVPTSNHQQQQTSKANGFPDRQVNLAPIEGARIDHIWSDISAYHYKISSNDLSLLENLVEFDRNLEEKLTQSIDDYQQQLIDEKTFLDKFHHEKFESLIEFSQINSLVSHYVDHTTLSSFQTKLYEHIGQTSPVYKTPISSPMHNRHLLNHESNSLLRISPRLHLNHRNYHHDDEIDNLIYLKSKHRSHLQSSPCSAMKFQQSIEHVRTYLNNSIVQQSEQHVKRQLFAEQKSTIKKRKNSHISNEHPTDKFQQKLSTMLALVHECSTLSTRALERARVQVTNEEIWSKLNTIEHDLETFVGKLNTTGGQSNSLTKEKTYLNLEQSVNEWHKYDQLFQQQFDAICPLDI